MTGKQADAAPMTTIARAAAATQADILVAIPFYKNEHLVAEILGSVIACAEELAVLGCQFALFNDSPGYAPLADELALWLPRLQACVPATLHTNATNLGFVKTMNLAVAQAVAAHANLLLLNSDTKLTPGAIPEMARVMAADPTLGFVNPRSNNATIATLPIGERFSASPAAVKRAAYAAMARHLPAVSYVPTAVGYCMLIRWEIIAELGGFDEIYGAGYNEENDLVMRASRCGWRAGMANHAFVWHEGEASFSTAAIDRDVWEPANRAILDKRYPEYGPQTGVYFDQPETIAERLIASLIPDANGRLDLAFDFSSFRAAHNGTFMAGRQLLQAAVELADHFNVFVICPPDVYEFHEYAALGVERSDTHSARAFAAIFRVGQPFDWNVMQRLTMTGVTLGVYMLDTIAIDCPQLSSPRLYNLWDFTLRHIDVVAGQSLQTQALLEHRFAIPPNVGRLMSMHSLDLADYVLPTTPPGTAAATTVVVASKPAKKRQAVSLLVVGNHYHHKYLTPTVNALGSAFPDRDIIAMGQTKLLPGEQPNPASPVALLNLPNISGLAVGAMAESEIGDLYSAASAIIFPSMAEGFGFPALNAIAMRRPVFLRRLPVFLELWAALGQTPNFHFYDTTSELTALLATIPAFVDGAEPDLAAQGGARSAREISAAMQAALTRVDFRALTARIRDMQFASDVWYRPDAPAVPDSPAERAARRLAGRVEHMAQGLFANRFFYLVTRTLLRATRPLRRFLRRLRGLD